MGRMPAKFLLAYLLVAGLLMPGSASARYALHQSAARAKAQTQTSRAARGQQIVINAKASKNGVKISGRKVVWLLRCPSSKPARVEFLIDGAMRWMGRKAPYRFRGRHGYLDSTKLSNGSHTLAVARIRGKSKVVSRVEVTVANKRRKKTSPAPKSPAPKSPPPPTTTPPTTTPTTTMPTTITPTTTTPTTTTPTTTTPTTTTPTTTTPTTTTPTTTTPTITPPPITTPTTPPPAGQLKADAIDYGHVELSWNAVSGASSYRVYRSGQLRMTTSGTSATDSMLWPQTSYDFRVDAVSASSSVLASMSASATTPALPSSGFPRPFASTSVWNTPIGDTPTVPNNAQFIANFVSNTKNPNMPLHDWAVSVAEAGPTSPFFNVVCSMYNPCTLTAFGAIPIPITASPDPSSDGHLAVYDPFSERTWGMWQASHSGSTWKASAGEAVSLTGPGLVPEHTTGSNAANFPALAGIIRPEEILQGHIDHALVFTVPEIYGAAHVCPATHNDGSSTNQYALREGMRLQLDPSLNVDSLSIPSWEKTIARALQTYGMYLRDGSGTFAIMAENPISRGYDAWAKVGLTSSGSVSLTGIPWDRFRVVSAPC
jgi:hypothetical protein